MKKIVILLCMLMLPSLSHATTLDELDDVTAVNSSAGQLLLNDGLGQWRNVNMTGDGSIDFNGVLTVTSPLLYQSRIQDADGDTLVETEESGDEDVIRFYTDGNTAYSETQQQRIQIGGKDFGCSGSCSTGWVGIPNVVRDDAYLTIRDNTTSASNRNWYELYIDADVNGTSLQNDTFGIHIDIQGTAASASTNGIEIISNNIGTDATDVAYGINSTVGRNYGVAGTLLNAFGYRANMVTGTGDIITNAYGFYASPTGSGTITNYYGLRIDDGGTTVTNDWGIYQTDPDSNNYFEGDLVIGNTTPLGRLSVDGDTDTNQLLIQGNATQTNPLATFENSAGTDQLTIGNTGNVTMAGDLTVTGDDLFMTTNTTGMLLIADGTNFNPIAMSGDGTINSSGLLTIPSDTQEECIWFENPAAADDFKTIWPAPKAITIAGISCESDQTVNMDLQVDDGTPTGVNGSDIACTSTWAEDSTLAGDTTMAVNDRLDLAIASVSGTPTWVSICWRFTYD